MRSQSLLCCAILCAAPAGAAPIGAAWTGDSNQAGAWYGMAVAGGDVNGDGYADAIVGAPYYKASIWGEREGGIGVYHGGPGGISGGPSFSMLSGDLFSSFGWSLAAGDVNGDGYDDVVVGAPGWGSGPSGTGAAYLHLGGPGGLTSTAAWSALSTAPNVSYGTTTAFAGDVNGDGYGDVLIGAPYHDGATNHEGLVELYLGSATGLQPLPAWSTSGATDEERGTSVAGAGDVDGDGYDDVLVGATGFSSGQTDEGAVWLFRGTPTGLQPAAAWSVQSDQDYARLGSAVAGAGDVDGDGYDDVIVGAKHYDHLGVGTGGAFLFLGSGAGLGPSPAWAAYGARASEEFGAALASAGDVNGDGLDDVVVGAPFAKDGPVGDPEGYAHVFLGRLGGLEPTAARIIQSNQGWAGYGYDERPQLGHAVAGVGDTNGDGAPDVLIGAWGYNRGHEDEGAAFLFHGLP